MTKDTLNHIERCSKRDEIHAAGMKHRDLIREAMPLVDFERSNILASINIELQILSSKAENVLSGH